MNLCNCEPNRWKGFVLGALGSVAGLMAMRLYWQQVAPLLAGSNPNGSSDGEDGGERSETEPLNDISLVGRQHKEDESSTAALGRLVYEQFAGESPDSAEAKTVLSYLVHWGYGMLQGGMYGAMRSSARGLDLNGGLLYGTGLWLIGDEIAVPLLGLQKGPTAAGPEQHFNRLGAHLAYGLGTAAATQVLRRIF